MPPIDLPVIGTLLHPTIGELLANNIAGTFTGSGTLTIPNIPVRAYGIHWHFFTVPLQWGFILGNPNIYIPSPMQLSVEYLDAGLNSYTQQNELVDIDGGIKLWLDPFPHTLHYHIQPGFVVIFDWMMLP